MEKKREKGTEMQGECTYMDWTLRSGKEQEIPSQPQGSPSAGLQLPSAPRVALKAVFSSSSASPATQSKKHLSARV